MQLSQPKAKSGQAKRQTPLSETILAEMGDFAAAGRLPSTTSTTAAMAPTTLLSSLLGASHHGTTAPTLVVIADTILCPGLILLRQFVQSALVLK